MSGIIKVDIHNHILPERWPDLKEVRRKETEERLDFLLHSEIWLWRVDPASPPLPREGKDAKGRPTLSSGGRELLVS